MLKYICAKRKMSQHTEKCKCIFKMIKMIFNLYEICNTY